MAKKTESNSKEYNFANTELIESVKQTCFDQGQNYIPKPLQFRISQLASCLRKQQFYKLVPELASPLTDKQKGIFALGNAVHEFIQKHLGPKDKVIGIEIPVGRKFEYNNPENKNNQIIEFELIGHADLLRLDNFGLKVVDFKTTTSRSFYYIQKQGANEHHKEQANLYASILAVDRYSILYIDKENFYMEEYSYFQDPVLFEQSIAKLYSLMHALQQNILFTMHRDFPDFWECHYVSNNEDVVCPFFKICDSNVKTMEDLEKYQVLRESQKVKEFTVSIDDFDLEEMPDGFEKFS